MLPTKSNILTAVCILAFSSLALAGNIEVSNENKKDLKVKIEPEGDSKASFTQQISPEEKSSFSIVADQLNGKSHYSIKGDTSAFTSGGKCEHLNVEKDYKVTFQNDKVGTTCVAEETKAVTSK